MKIKPGINDVLWMAAGAAVLLVCLLVVFHFHKDQDPAAQVAFQARRVELLDRMQLDLASAAEAEKSAVLAITDPDSLAFADQARAAAAKVAQGRRELEELLTAGGTQGEQVLLAQFATAFAEFQRIDKELLALAVKNTNLKASSLAFGPAATALTAMNATLSRLVAATADSPETKSVLLLAFGAQTSALHLLTLLPPHIAEEDEKKEDEMEAVMAADDAQVRKNLTSLAEVPQLSNNPDLVIATARYADFTKLKTQIIALSRENTNVRSLSISLNQKRKVMLVCQDALGALQLAILAEPIAGVTSGTPVKPR